MRKLATIEKIIDIQPIPDADAIEVATVRGWKVVVKKNEFNVGDLVIYLEVDSWVPMELAPFLVKEVTPKEYNGVKGERLRTVRLRGQISQGLILPITDEYSFTYYEGMDVTDRLGVQKYEPPVPACLSGVVKGSWPSSIPKTDQERIQNLKNEYDQLRLLTYEVTEKLEGSSCTMGLLDGEFIVCSRNLNLRETEGNTFWNMARKYDVESKLREFEVNDIIIQGETVGEGIQGNYYGLKGQDFYVFDIYHVHTARYISHADRLRMCHDLGLKHVPVISSFPLQAIECLGEDNIESVLKYADGQSLINPQKLREGVVFKQIDGQAHFKAVSNRYLIKSGN